MLNTMTRWNPANGLNARDPFFRLVDSFFNQDLLPSEEVSNRSWMPPVDIQETEEAYRLVAELPGLTKDDINITLENNVLRLTGERKFEKGVTGETKDAKKEAKNQGYHRIERAYGTFVRAFTLPSQVSHDKVEAKFENGLLTIMVPKAELAKPRRIAIA
jgi:HSP20 family protein